MTTPIRILAVGGTWSKQHEQDRPQWYQAVEPPLPHLLPLFLRRRGFQWLVGIDGRAFEWGARIAGHQFWRRIVGFITRRTWEPSLVDWQVAGANLYAWVCPPLVRPEHWLPAAVTHLWLHSHAGNLGFFACADGLRANTFTTFCTPPRADMVTAIKRARRNMGYWIHVHSDHADKVAIAGTVGDGDMNVIHKFSELRDPETGQVLGFSARSLLVRRRELGHMAQTADIAAEMRDIDRELAEDLCIGPDLEIFVDDGHSGILNHPAGFRRLDLILDIIRSRHGRTFDA